MPNKNNQFHRIQPRQAYHDGSDWVDLTSSNINSTGVKNSLITGEISLTTDTNSFYQFNGTVNVQIGMMHSSTTADPTTTEIPNSGEFGIHKNTTSGNVYLAYNDGGTIKKVQLT